MTAGYGKITGQQMMGLNCTACHVGELHYNGRAFRMDGGPSMAYVNAFVKAIVDETVATAGSRSRRLRFLDRWRRVQLVPLPDYPVVQHGERGRRCRQSRTRRSTPGSPVPSGASSPACGWRLPTGRS